MHLEAAIEYLRRRKVAVILAGLRRQPARALVRADWRHRLPDVRVVRRLERGLSIARGLGARPAAASGRLHAP